MMPLALCWNQDGRAQAPLWEPQGTVCSCTLWGFCHLPHETAPDSSGHGSQAASFVLSPCGCTSTPLGPGSEPLHVRGVSTPPETGPAPVPPLALAWAPLGKGGVWPGEAEGCSCINVWVYSEGSSMAAVGLPHQPVPFSASRPWPRRPVSSAAPCE